MVPVRTEKAHRTGESSSAVSRNSKTRRKHQHKDIADSSASPGVQKLKSSLRQTRRLLAKDKLAADVRVGTERRLKALEADIVQAESAKKERTMSVRYHKVKFFERQKVLRKINQTQKQLSTREKSISSKKNAEGLLSDLRIDLNYILHFPKSRKYISLFPPETRQGHSETQSSLSKADVAKTNAQRDEVRKWIRERMEKGELQLEPELHLDAREGNRSKNVRVEWGITDDARGEKPSTKKDKESKSLGGGVEADAFFGEDDTDDEKDSEGRDDDEHESV